MTIPRQLAPTMGPAYDGVEFLEGSLTGIEELAIGWMKNYWFGKICNSVEFIKLRFIFRGIQGSREIRVWVMIGKLLQVIETKLSNCWNPCFPLTDQ